MVFFVPGKITDVVKRAFGLRDQLCVLDAIEFCEVGDTRESHDCDRAIAPGSVQRNAILFVERNIEDKREHSQARPARLLLKEVNAVPE